MRKLLMVGVIGLAMITAPANAARRGDVRIQGQGTIEDGRTFSVSAVLYQDGTARGQATLINRNFTGENGHAPYSLHIDITCAKQLTDGSVAIGGFTRRTNDPSLVDAVFFTVQDNGKDDLLSRAYFYDGDPNTTGDPASCQLITPDYLPMEEVIRGNINVH